MSSTKITALFEYAEDQLILSDINGGILVIKQRNVIQRIDGPEVYTHGHDLLLPLPDFDDQNFPYCIKSSGSYIFLINLKTKSSQEMLHANLNGINLSQVCFFDRFAGGFDLNFTA